eukprot:8222268-Alexandrium_andersonii.AAC.1
MSASLVGSEMCIRDRPGCDDNIPVSIDRRVSPPRGRSVLQKDRERHPQAVGHVLRQPGQRGQCCALSGLGCLAGVCQGDGACRPDDSRQSRRTGRLPASPKGRCGRCIAAFG